MLKSKIILGIDPGYGITGYGLVECVGSRLKALDYGVIETSSHDEFPERLKTLNTELSKIIKKSKSDTILIKKQNYAQNGDKVVAILNGNEATLKTFYKENGHVRLQPANKNYQPIIIKNNQQLGNLTVSQWISAFEKEYPIQTRNISAPVDFVITNQEAKKINPLLR